MSATERGGPLSVTYKRASELASGADETGSTAVLTVGGVEVEILSQSASCVLAVAVDPETQAHALVHEQVADSTAANVGVLVSIAVGILNEHNAKHRADEHLSNSSRSARGNVEEHVKQ